MSDGGEGQIGVAINNQTTVSLIGPDAEVNQTTGSPVGANMNASYQMTVYPTDNDTNANYQTTVNSVNGGDWPQTGNSADISDPTEYIEPVDPTDINRALEIDEDQIRNIIRVSLEKTANGGDAANGGHFSHRVLEIDEEEIRNSIRERVQEANKVDENFVASFASGTPKEEGGEQEREASTGETYNHGEGDQKLFLRDRNSDVLMGGGWSEEESNEGEIMDKDLEPEVTTEPDMAGGGEVEDDNTVDWITTQEKGDSENGDNKFSNTDGEHSLEEGFDVSIEEGKGEIDDEKEEEAGGTINSQMIRERIMAMEREADEIERFDPEKVEANLKRLEGYFGGGYMGVTKSIVFYKAYVYIRCCF